MAESDPQVRIEHVRKTGGMCARGVRTWLVRHGFDYAVFLRDGYPASAIEAVGDALGSKVAAVARAEQKGETS